MPEGLSVRAGGTIAPCRAVKWDTSADNQVLQGTSNSVNVGIAQEETNTPPGIAGSDNTIAATITQPILVYTEGAQCLAEAGAAITAGDPLISDSNGRLITATGTGKNIIGFALQAASGAGVKFNMRVNRYYE